MDLSARTTNKEILPLNGEQLETEIRDTLLRAIRQTAITEMTKTIRQKTKLTTVTQIICIVWLTVSSGKNVQQR